MDILSKEYQYGTSIAGLHRNRLNEALGDILTLADVAFDNEAKLAAFKAAVKKIMWNLCDKNQHFTYYVLGIEDYQYGDPMTEDKEA